MHAPVLVIALILDRVIGDPGWLWRYLPHPIVWFGKAIEFADKRFNRTDLTGNERRRNGIFSIGVLLVATCVIAALLAFVFSALGSAGSMLEVLVVFVLLAQKSLAQHVGAVADALKKDGLEGGRRAVGLIVGRNPETLDAAGIARAAIESLAENFSDGVVAPAFWYLVGGLPGIAAYKMLNTADSMIGHKNAKYLEFGWASARLDDLANWIPARLSILFIAAGALLSFRAKAALAALRVSLRDHGLHRSPNSGWPEAAMAGALDLQLGGPRQYLGERVDEPMLNAEGKSQASEADIVKAITFFLSSCDGMVLIVLFTFLFV